MITLFTSARPFVDSHTSIIQRNAIASWRSAFPDAEIIIIGDEFGVAEIAQELHLVHLRDVEKNSQGKPLRSAVWRAARTRATNPLLCFLSADIILLDDFINSVKGINIDKFLMVGRRVDLDITTLIDFGESGWQQQLRDRVQQEGVLHGPAAVDYAIFPRDLPDEFIPPFSINLPGWDGWFIYKFKMAKVPIIDATECITAIHQNHDEAKRGYRKNSVWKDLPQARAELDAAGGFSAMLTMREADWILTHSGLKRPLLTQRLCGALAMFGWWRSLLGWKRQLQQYFL